MKFYSTVAFCVAQLGFSAALAVGSYHIAGMLSATLVWICVDAIVDAIREGK